MTQQENKPLDNHEEVPEVSEKPPFFRKWSGMYWLLVIFLVVQIIIYYLITISF